MNIMIKYMFLMTIGYLLLAFEWVIELESQMVARIDVEEA